MNLLPMITSKLSSFLLVVLCSSFITAVVSGGSIVCKKVDCGCQFTNASGIFEISMKGISNRGSPKYVDVPPYKANPWVYDIDPCYGFNGIGPCEGVTMCQKSTNGLEAFPVAKPSIESYSDYDHENKKLQVTYNTFPSRSDKMTRQMIINLMYGTEPSVSNVVQSMSSDVALYTLTITDPSLKPQHQSSGGSSSAGGDEDISSGSVIVIIFAVVLVVYLIAGIMFMKFGRGKTGKEFKPSVDFGSTLPRLIKVQYENAHSRNTKGTGTTL